MAFDNGVEEHPKITTALRWTVKSTGNDNLTSMPLDHFLDGLPFQYHIQRMKASASAFEWPNVLDLICADSGQPSLEGALIDYMRPLVTTHLKLPADRQRSFKVRILIAESGEIRIDCSGPEFLKPPLHPLSFAANPFISLTQTESISAHVTVALLPVIPSLFTQHKTTQRTVYNEAYRAALDRPEVPTTAEVLVYNTSEEIMEAVSSTVYFKKNSEWFTPSAGCGGNLGTTRALALDSRWCKEGILTVSEVRQMDRQIIWLSNAVRGFWPAEVCLDLAKFRTHVEKSTAA